MSSAEATNLLRLAQLQAAISNPTEIYDSKKSYQETVESIVNSGLDVNYQIPDTTISTKNKKIAGCTALHLAAEIGAPISVEILLKKAVDITLKDANGQTALRRAVEMFDKYRDDYDDDLLYRGGDTQKEKFCVVEETNFSSASSIPSYMENIKKQKRVWEMKGILRSNDTIDRILSAQVDAKNTSNPTCENGVSHFHIACMVNHVKAIEFFLEAGIPVNHTVKNDSPIFAGYTALHFAVRYSNVEAVKLLLQHRADPSVRDSENKAPLDLLIERNMELVDSLITKALNCYQLKRERELNETIIKFFLEERESLNFRDQYGLEELHAASTLRDTSVIKNLLKSEVDVKVSSATESPAWPGYTPLHFAAHFNIKTVKLLIQSGANISTKAVNGITPLELCMERFRPSDVHLILSVNEDFRNITLSDGETKLLDLIKAMNNVDKFKKFLKDTKCINSTVSKDSPIFPGCTPLHIAVMMSEKSMHLWNCWYTALDKFMEESDQGNSSYKELDTYNRSREAKKKYYKRIEKCLELNADINIHDERSMTPVHVAFYLRKRKVVMMLLKSCLIGIPKNPKDHDNLSHFHIACLAGNTKIAKKFLLANVDVNEPISRTVKWYWAKELRPAYQPRPVLELISISAGSTPLHIAVILEKGSLMNMLVKNSADVYAKDSHNLTAIHRIMANPKKDNYYTNTRYIVDNLEDLKDCNDNEFQLSHLHVACFMRSEYAVQKLLDQGVDTEIRVTGDASSEAGLYAAEKYAGFKALDLAGVMGDFIPFEIEKIFIERGDDVHAEDPRGQTLFQKFFNSFRRSSMMDKESICKLFKFDENSIISIDKAGLTMLHLACFYFEVPSVQKLLEEEAKVNAQIRVDSGYVWAGFTPLHFLIDAIEHRRDKVNFNDIKCILVLLELYKADATIRNARNWTPVHMAFYLPERTETCEELGCPRLVPFLVSRLMACQKNFEVNPMDDDGVSHFHIACTNDTMMAQVEKFLDQGNVDINAPINPFGAKRPELKCCPGFTPLHLAVANHCRNVTRLLLERGADVKAEDFHGDTPLHVAYRFAFPHRELIEKMLSLGADVDARNIAGLTPTDLLPKTRAPASLHSTASPREISCWGRTRSRLRRILYRSEHLLSFRWFRRHRRRRRFMRVMNKYIARGRKIYIKKLSGKTRRNVMELECVSIASGDNGSITRDSDDSSDDDDYSVNSDSSGSSE